MVVMVVVRVLDDGVVVMGVVDFSGDGETFFT